MHMKMNNNYYSSVAFYSSVGYLKLLAYLNHLKQLIDGGKCQDPYFGLRIVEVGFEDPYLRCAEYEVIALAVMCLLKKYAYNTGFEYGKFTIGYVMNIPTRDVSYNIGTTIYLNDSSGNVSLRLTLKY